ncbi:MAG: hypothetical protein WD342_21085 [Verrucomicrobiales bacterium]
MINSSILLLLEALSYCAAILGIPAAIYVYVKEQSKLRDEREYGTYNSLDDKYIELQTICLSYPELDVFDSPYSVSRKLEEPQKLQEEAILLIRISLFERAFLMYRHASSKSRRDQWISWDREIQEWMERENFKAAWDKYATYFDRSFYQQYNIVENE